ncbi:hypothetical protein HFO89_11010 [Rhizobium leguminosarum]|uniref:hypothetical protein n=1 Tax=Rhizobium leguminosarum TaxID=384 RepID=UPI001C977EF9|nr:hypothetical protein [Rhizobium leguminosarum]MBY5456889.1 hypothetical protein [Rhizobium leguminosarum]
MTRSTPASGGEAVVARIWHSIDGGPWSEITNGSRPQRGVMVVTEPKCDISVSYNASAMWFTHTRDIQTTTTCNEPEVVFNDFVPTETAAAINPARLTNPDAWMSALGGDAVAAQKSEQFATKLNDAILNGDFGVVAIASSELAAQLRTAGKEKEAAIFTSLSVDATVRGVAKARNLSLEDWTALSTDQKGDMALSAKGKNLVQIYQVEDLGISDKLDSFGKTNWKTMRSLEGGGTTKAVDWHLPVTTLEKFDAKALNFNPT